MAITSKPANAQGQACAWMGKGNALEFSVLKSSMANSSTKGGKEVLSPTGEKNAETQQRLM
jgi:hypothetical protein